MRKFITLFVALTAVLSLCAEPLFLKNNWDGGGDDSWAWKEMAVNAENNSWTLDDVVFGGNGVNVNSVASDEGSRWVPAEDIKAYDAYTYDEVALAAGDIVMLIYDPEEYSQYDPHNHSGVMALVLGKALFAKNNWDGGEWAWKRMSITEYGTYQLHRVIFGNGGGVNISPLANDDCPDKRWIVAANITAFTSPGYDVTTLEAGDDFDLIYDPEEYNQHNPDVENGLQAIVWDKWNAPKTYLKHNWEGGDNWFWKKMDRQTDNTFVMKDIFNGGGVNLNDKKEEDGSRWIEAANIQSLINFEPAELAAGDSAIFIYDPEEYSQYEPSKSGLIAQIEHKAGYALRGKWGGNEASWKNMVVDPEDDDWWVLENVIFDGNDVQIVIGHEINTIKAENIQAYINLEEAELSAGDKVTFVFRPSMVNAYDPKESGLYAHIIEKTGYAIRGTWGAESASWKNLASDGDGAFFVDNVLFDGQNVQVLALGELLDIKPENITAVDYTTGDLFDLEAGDIVVFSFDPDTRSAYDETQSGLWAVLIQKHGYALQSFWGEMQTSWKELTEDEGKWILENAIFDGHDLYINNFAGALGARKIEAKNVQGYINSEFAELAAGDSVIFIYDPETYSQYDPKASGLSAMITKKAAPAIKIGDEWKNLTQDPEDEDWWDIDEVAFDGNAVQIAYGNEILTIKPENIGAYIAYDDAELEVGDVVMYVFHPSMVNHYDPSAKCLFAMVEKKLGYAMRGTWGEGEIASWKNFVLDEEQDDETWVLNNVIFDGEEIQLLNDDMIRTIDPANVIALMFDDYSETVLEAGDLVMFVYTPDTYSQYDPSQPGLMALIIRKHEATGIDNTEVNTNATKALINGQIFIIKNGKTYNVTGALVK